MPNFFPYPIEKDGILSDLTGDEYPATFSRWNGEAELTSGATHFLYIENETSISFANRAYELAPGMYASIPGPTVIHNGRGIVASRFNYDGFFQIGGPVEEVGRLRYIDGCTDSLLIPPVILGDPCLNLLHIPPNTEQTRHTHPSFRTGLIISGSGECVTPDGCHPLSPGLAFLIPADAQHSFHTSNEALRVIAFHPDSDFGPTHEIHPMVNRTIV